MPRLCDMTITNESSSDYSSLASSETLKSRSSAHLCLVQWDPLCPVVRDVTPCHATRYRTCTFACVLACRFRLCSDPSMDEHILQRCYGGTSQDIGLQSYEIVNPAMIIVFGHTLLAILQRKPTLTSYVGGGHCIHADLYLMYVVPTSREAAWRLQVSHVLNTDDFDKHPTAALRSDSDCRTTCVASLSHQSYP